MLFLLGVWQLPSCVSSLVFGREWQPSSGVGGRGFGVDHTPNCEQDTSDRGAAGERGREGLYLLRGDERGL